MACLLLSKPFYPAGRHFGASFPHMLILRRLLSCPDGRTPPLSLILSSRSLYYVY